jgi:hypothetical protein
VAIVTAEVGVSLLFSIAVYANDEQIAHVLDVVVWHAVALPNNHPYLELLFGSGPDVEFPIPRHVLDGDNVKPESQQALRQFAEIVEQFVGFDRLIGDGHEVFVEESALDVDGGPADEVVCVKETVEIPDLDAELGVARNHSLELYSFKERRVGLVVLVLFSVVVLVISEINNEVWV